MSWNACSLRNKLLELEIFMRTNNVVIATIQETWLTPDVKITFSDYNIVRSDRTNIRQGGGVTILVHKNLRFRIIPLHSPSLCIL